MPVVFALVVAGSGCALGYGAGKQSTSFAEAPESGLSFGSDSARASAWVHEFRLVDTTGFMLAGITNTARAHAARQDAVDRAQYQRPGRDGKVVVDYEYETFPILSGLLLDTRLRFAAGDMEFGVGGAEPVAAPGSSYWGFDMRGEFYSFTPLEGLPMVGAISFGAYADSYESGNYNQLTTDVTAGVNLTYLASPDLMATFRLQHGVAMALIGQLSGGPLLVPRFEVEAGYRLHEYLSVLGTFRGSRDTTGEAPVVTWRGFVSLVATFGTSVSSGAR